MTTDIGAPAIIVRGLGDVASAVAWRLFRDGHAVALHQGPEPPRASRRRMAFADAWFDGRASLQGVEARRHDPLAGLSPVLRARQIIPVLVAPLDPCLSALDCRALVDARMRKRTEPEDQRGRAPLVIGLGPGFVAGGNVHRAVETAWGERLGAVIDEGPTLPLAGEPRAIAGIGRERVVYAPHAGRLTSDRVIGAKVEAGESVAAVAGTVIAAPIGGTIRGLVRPGVTVEAGDKILEIDPRPPDAAHVAGLGERPRRIAAGVSQAVAAWTRPRAAAGDASSVA